MQYIYTHMCIIFYWSFALQYILSQWYRTTATSIPAIIFIQEYLLVAGMSYA